MDTTTARAVSSRLADILSREFLVAMADFLAALADFDRCRLWEPLGYTSLWHYLHRELGLSKGTAHYRVVAAGLVARFPEVEAALRAGRLCITSVVELSKVLTDGNQAEALPRFFHLSKQEAQEVVAELRPRAVAPRREVVTAFSVQPVELLAPLAGVTEEVQVAPTSTSTSTPTPTPSPSPDAAPGTRPAVEPLTADLRRLHVTVSRRFLEKLEAARDALSHARPGADAEAILEAGLDLILARQAKRRAQVARPRRARAEAARVTDEPARVPAEVRRAVWTRDAGRCQWPMAGGGICGSTHRPELDHIHPRARGGPSTEENLRVLCDAHNKLAARLAYGERWMRRYLRREGTPEALELSRRGRIARPADPGPSSASPVGRGPPGRG